MADRIKLEDILASLGKLSREDRYVLLDGVLDHMDSSAWSEVRYRVHKRFSCDIIGKLPIELVASIAKQLELRDLISLQRVSRRWKQLLSSPEVQVPVLRAVIGPGISISDPAKALERRIRIQHMLPVSKVLRKIPELEHGTESGSSEERPYHSRIQHFAYCNGILAYILQEDRTALCYFDLKSGQHAQLRTENREAPLDVAISEDLIVSKTRRAFHVWRLRTHEYKTFLTLSAENCTLTASGTNVLIACGFGLNMGKVIHWEFDSGVARLKYFDALCFASPCSTKDQFEIIRTDRGVESNSVPFGGQEGRPLFSLIYEKYAVSETSGEFEVIFSRQSRTLVDSRKFGTGFWRLAGSTDKFSSSMTDFKVVSQNRPLDELQAPPAFLSVDETTATLSYAEGRFYYVGMGVFYSSHASENEIGLVDHKGNLLKRISWVEEGEEEEEEPRPFFFGDETSWGFLHPETGNLKLLIFDTAC